MRAAKIHPISLLLFLSFPYWTAVAQDSTAVFVPVVDAAIVDTTAVDSTVETATAAPDSIVAKNPTGAMLRSIFVPGWGQFYNGKWFKGILIAGTEIGLITNAVILNQWAKEASTLEDYYFYIDNRNLTFWILGATILYSMADAYVDAQLYGFDESPDLSFFIKQKTEPLIGLTSSILTLQLSFQF
jgi:hypothetical protein